MTTDTTIDQGPTGVRQGLSGFWMVWADNGRSSRKVHVTEASALREARRLAIKVPGTRFHVLHAYTSFRVSPPKPEAPAIVGPAWISWSGGECPVSPETRIDVEYKGDPPWITNVRAGVVRWDHSPDLPVHWHIGRYRIWPLDHEEPNA